MIKSSFLTPKINAMDEKFSPYRLTVTIHSAANLPIMDYLSSDPFVVLYFDGRVAGKTPTIYKSLNPSWETSFTGSLLHPHCTVKMKVYDEDTDKQDDFMGIVVQDIDHLVAGQASRVTKPLMKLDLTGEKKGTLTFSLLLTKSTSLVKIEPPFGSATTAETARDAVIREVMVELSRAGVSLESVRQALLRSSFVAKSSIQDLDRSALRDLLRDVAALISSSTSTPSAMASGQSNAIADDSMGDLSGLCRNSRQSISSTQINLPDIVFLPASPQPNPRLLFRFHPSSKEASNAQIRFLSQYSLWVWTRWLSACFRLWRGVDTHTPAWMEAQHGRLQSQSLDTVLTSRDKSFVGRLVLSLARPYQIICEDVDSGTIRYTLDLQLCSGIVVSEDAQPALPLFLTISELSVCLNERNYSLEADDGDDQDDRHSISMSPAKLAHASKFGVTICQGRHKFSRSLESFNKEHRMTQALQLDFSNRQSDSGSMSSANSSGRSSGGSSSEGVDFHDGLYCAPPGRAAGEESEGIDVFLWSQDAVAQSSGNSSSSSSTLAASLSSGVSAVGSGVAAVGSAGGAIASSLATGGVGASLATAASVAVNPLTTQLQQLLLQQQKIVAYQHIPLQTLLRFAPKSAQSSGTSSIFRANLNSTSSLLVRVLRVNDFQVDRKAWNHIQVAVKLVNWDGGPLDIDQPSVKTKAVHASSADISFNADVVLADKRVDLSHFVLIRLEEVNPLNPPSILGGAYIRVQDFTTRLSDPVTLRLVHVKSKTNSLFAFSQANQATITVQFQRVVEPASELFKLRFGFGIRADEATGWPAAVALDTSVSSIETCSFRVGYEGLRLFHLTSLEQRSFLPPSASNEALRVITKAVHRAVPRGSVTAPSASSTTAPLLQPSPPPSSVAAHLEGRAPTLQERSKPRSGERKALWEENSNLVVYLCKERVSLSDDFVDIPWSQVKHVTVVTPSVLSVIVTLNRYFGSSETEGSVFRPIDVEVFVSNCRSAELKDLITDKIAFKEVRATVLAALLSDRGPSPSPLSLSAEGSSSIEVRPRSTSVSLPPQASELSVAAQTFLQLNQLLIELREDRKLIESKLTERYHLDSASTFKSRKLLMTESRILQVRECRLLLYVALLQNGKKELDFSSDALDAILLADTRRMKRIEVLDDPVETANSRINYLLDMAEVHLTNAAMCGWEHQGGRLETYTGRIVNDYLVEMVSVLGKFFDTKNDIKEVKGLASKTKLIVSCMLQNDRLANVLEVCMQNYSLEAHPRPELTLFLNIETLVSWYSNALREEMGGRIRNVMEVWRNPSNDAGGTAAKYKSKLPWTPFRESRDEGLILSHIPEDTREYLKTYLQYARINDPALHARFGATLKVLDEEVFVSFASSFQHLASEYSRAIQEVGDSPVIVPDSIKGKVLSAEERADYVVDVAMERLEWLCSVANDAWRVCSSDDILYADPSLAALFAKGKRSLVRARPLHSESLDRAFSSVSFSPNFGDAMGETVRAAKQDFSRVILEAMDLASCTVFGIISADPLWLDPAAHTKWLESDVSDSLSKSISFTNQMNDLFQLFSSVSCLVPPSCYRTFLLSTARRTVRRYLHLIKSAFSSGRKFACDGTEISLIKVDCSNIKSCFVMALEKSDTEVKSDEILNEFKELDLLEALVSYPLDGLAPTLERVFAICQSNPIESRAWASFCHQCIFLRAEVASALSHSKKRMSITSVFGHGDSTHQTSKTTDDAARIEGERRLEEARLYDQACMRTVVSSIKSLADLQQSMSDFVFPADMTERSNAFWVFDDYFVLTLEDLLLRSSSQLARTAVPAISHSASRFLENIFSMVSGDHSESAGPRLSDSSQGAGRTSSTSRSSTSRSSTSRSSGLGFGLALPFGLGRTSDSRASGSRNSNSRSSGAGGGADDGTSSSMMNTLIVKGLRLFNLPCLSGKPKSYVQFSVDGKVLATTSTRKDDTNPMWVDDVYEMPFAGLGGGKTLVCSIYYKRWMAVTDELIGAARVPLSSLLLSDVDNENFVVDLVSANAIAAASRGVEDGFERPSLHICVSLKVH